MTTHIPASVSRFVPARSDHGAAISGKTLVAIDDDTVVGAGVVVHSVRSSATVPCRTRSPCRASASARAGSGPGPGGTGDRGTGRGVGAVR
ncbi:MULTISPECIES: hypothetical protein [Pseudonocardia]|uniref:hypothetical protein n=1 Tax=Pseudonocardia TaxID=1847 RepID=UPI001AD7E083|nr:MULTISPECIES: hypothetical protein [Pseudonocardia]MBO4240742.1 hypothetical protein [Pseudonocardia alni]